MLRTFLLVLPGTIVIALAGLIVMIPVTWVLRDARPMYEVARWVVKFLIWLAGLRIERSGPHPRTAPQPCIYLCNHVSILDPPVVFPELPRVAPMAKASVFRLPLLGYGMRMADFIPVEREKPESRRKAMETAVARIKKGFSLLIFPEGTRSPHGNMLPFRPGPFTMAIETQVPIVPITIAGTRDLMPKGQAGIRPGRVRLVFHPPISTAGLTMADRDALMQRVRETIASALPQPASTGRN